MAREATTGADAEGEVPKEPKEGATGGIAQAESLLLLVMRFGTVLVPMRIGVKVGPMLLAGEGLASEID